MTALPAPAPPAGALPVADHTLDAPAGVRPVPTVLRDARRVVEPVLREAVGRLDPGTQRWSAHHLGLVDAAGRPVEGGGGKGVRGALAVLGGRFASSSTTDPPTTVDALVAPGAAAVELVHEFSLVHDDLMDGDTERRHRPTVWALWGASEAVLAGDALAALAQEIVLESSSPHRAEAGLLLARTVRALVAGQVEDIAFERLPLTGPDRVDPARCRAMIAGKTGSLLSAAAAIGAVLAGAPTRVVDALRTFGDELGTAFQIVDDLLGIWGDPNVTGKPAGPDLRSAKKTLPVVYAVEHGGAAGRELAERLEAPRETREDPWVVAELAALVERAGGRRWAAAEIERCRERGERALAGIDQSPSGQSPSGQSPSDRSPSDRALAELVAVGRLLADRES